MVNHRWDICYVRSILSEGSDTGSEKRKENTREVTVVCSHYDVSVDKNVSCAHSATINVKINNKEEDDQQLIAV